MARNGQAPDIKRIRNHVDNFGDPYLDRCKDAEVTVCSECNAIYIAQRWQLKEQVDPEKLRNQSVHFTVCPACKKVHDKAAGGVVNLAGSFIAEHKDDIINLIRNEGNRAMGINPLERIIDIEKEGSGYNVLTTNEKLAQRIGRELHKAYDGEVSYKWSGDDKLVRVFWKRD